MAWFLLVSACGRGDVGVGGRAAAIGAWSRNLRVACFLPLSSQAFLLLILPTSWWRAFGSPWVYRGSRGSFGVCKGEWLLCLRIHRIVVLGMKIEVRRSIQLFRLLQYSQCMNLLVAVRKVFSILFVVTLITNLVFAVFVNLYPIGIHMQKRWFNWGFQPGTLAFGIRHINQSQAPFMFIALYNYTLSTAFLGSLKTLHFLHLLKITSKY